MPITYDDLTDNEKTEYNKDTSAWYKAKSRLTNERNTLATASGRTVQDVDSDISALDSAKPTADSIRAKE